MFKKKLPKSLKEDLKTIAQFPTCAPVTVNSVNNYILVSELNTPQDFSQAAAKVLNCAEYTSGPIFNELSGAVVTRAQRRPNRVGESLAYIANRLFMGGK